jgi:hypothetical protein
MTTDQNDDNLPDENGPEETFERPWIHLKSTHDVEAWIDSYNWELQRRVKQSNAAVGAGVCFILAHGGEIFMHTTPEGEVLLDVTPEAEWVAPVIAAATDVNPPNAQIWVLPGDVLTQLIFGLSALIASTRPVTSHPFNTKKKQRITW